MILLLETREFKFLQENNFDIISLFFQFEQGRMPSQMNSHVIVRQQR